MATPVKAPFWARAFALLLLLAPPLASGASAAETTRVEAARLRFTVPATWTRVPAADNEAARYRLPAAGGDMGESFLVLRTTEGEDAVPPNAQLELWYARFTQPDGRETKAAASVLTRKVDDLQVTRADVSGTYVAAAAPVQAGVSGYRLLGAVVEGDGGPWLFVAIGPQATAGGARADFDALLLSLERH
jgi:hypothetical protein